MSTAVVGKRDHALLIGDGFLITLGAATLSIAVAFSISGIGSISDSARIAMELGSAVIMLSSVVAGIILAWRLNRRRIEPVAVAGALLGAAAGGAPVFVIGLASWLIGLPLRLVTEWEYAGPVALLVILSLGAAAVIAWLIRDAVRDLASEKSDRHQLDRARIASAAIFGVLVAVSVVLVFAYPGPEQGEAPIWALAAGLVGAGAVAGADLATAVAARRGNANGLP